MPSSRGRARNIIVRGFVGLGLLLWVAVPVVVISIAIKAAQDDSLTQPVAVTVPVEVNDEIVTQNVELALAWVTPPALVAPAWSGITEEVRAASGSTLNQGDVLAVVGGIERLAIYTERPFGRSLQLGSEGPDVQALNDILTGLGYAAGGSDVFSSSTQRGVSALARDLGVGEDVEAFEPDWFVYMPAAAVTVGSTSMPIAAPAPAPGVEVVSLQPTLTSARVTAPGAVSTPTSIDAGSEGQPGSEPGDSNVTVPSLQVPTNSVLQIEGVTLRAETGSSMVFPEDLPLVMQLVEPQQATTPATLTTQPVSDSFTAPPSAIFAVPTADACVVRVRDDVELVIPVTIVGASYSRTVISGELLVSDLLVVSPTAADREQNPCS